jgi:hypothetical protein
LILKGYKSVVNQPPRLSLPPLRAALLFGALLAFNTFATSPIDTPSESAESPSNTLIYPGNQRQIYPIVLLKKALIAAGAPHTLIPSEIPYGQKRSLIDLARGQGIDVSWSMTSKTREDMLLPVRIPVFKGLIGWRLPLIRAADTEQFHWIDDARTLSRLKVGQMHDWPDTDILLANGFNLFSSSTYEGLFRMLAIGRIDYFPRSVVEIWRELDQHPGLGLSIEPSIVLHYPTAFYFFVAKNRPDLHDLILKGLSIMRANGEFDRLFMEYHGDVIERAQLHQRKIISIPNDQLSELTPLGQKNLWYQITAAPSNSK